MRISGTADMKSHVHTLQIPIVRWVHGHYATMYFLAAVNCHVLIDTCCPLDSSGSLPAASAATQQASEKADRSWMSRLRSALRICSSSLRRMMARSDLGGTSRKGGRMKSCWSLPIIARVWACSYYGATLRSLRASHTVGNEADGPKSCLSAPDKPQANREEDVKIRRVVDCKDSTDSG